MKMIRWISIVSTFTALVKSLYIWRKHRHTRHFTLNWCGNTEFLQGKIYQLSRLFVGLSLGIDFGWRGHVSMSSVSPFFEIAPRTLMGSFNQVAAVGDVLKKKTYFIPGRLFFHGLWMHVMLFSPKRNQHFRWIPMFFKLFLLTCDENKQPQPPHIYAKNTRRSLPFRASWAMWHKMPLSNKSRRPLRGISLPGQRCWNSDRYTPPRNWYQKWWGMENESLLASK